MHTMHALKHSIHTPPLFRQARWRLKTILLSLLSMPVLALAQADTGSTSNVSLASIAAVVNGQAVTHFDLDRRMTLLKQQLSRSADKVPADDAQLRAAVLERLVLETLMLQTAKQQRLIPSDDTVNQAILDNAAQLGLDKEAFLAKVEQSGLTSEQYATDLKNDIAMSSVRSKNLVQRTKISESAIDRFLSDPESGVTIEYTPLALLLPKPDGVVLDAATLAQLKASAQALRVKALNARTAEAFIALQPALPKASVHKVAVGQRALDKFPDLISKEIEGMTVGTVSNVLENAAGFYIVRLQNKQTVLPKVSQTLVRHILLGVADAKSETEVRRKVTDLHNKLTLNIDLFSSFAKTFSEDGSATAGGDLGWVFPNDLVPGFERVMDSLQPKEMAFPVRTQFGWHIIQVLDRKTVEIPLVRLRNQARNILREQQQKQALTDWLEQLKAQAYIEYRDSAVKANNLVNTNKTTP